jgi:hypothetical protein
MKKRKAEFSYKMACKRPKLIYRTICIKIHGNMNVTSTRRSESTKLLLTTNSLPVREEAKMRKDTGANHFHVDVQVQDVMREFGLWVQPSLNGPARSQISVMPRLKVMKSPVN